MLRKLRARINYANVVATLALTLALGGGAYAAVALPKNSVGSAQIKANAVKSSKVKNHSLLAQDFKLGQLPRGPKGDPCRATNPQCRGPKGPAGPGIRWALVKGTDGSVLEQSGGITALRDSKGVYYVDFGSAVTGHPISATIHSAPTNVATITGVVPCSGTLASLDPDTITCAAHNTAGEVEVGTANIGGGGASDQDFYIEVFN